MSSKKIESKTKQTETDPYNPDIDVNEHRALIPPSMYGLGSLIKVWTESKIASVTKHSRT